MLGKRKRTGPQGGARAPPAARRAAQSILSSAIRRQRAISAARKGKSKVSANYKDLAATNYVMDTTGTITLIATVAQGAGYDARVGKKIAWKSIQVRGYVIGGSTCVVGQGALILVYDRRPTGVLPAITDVLVSADSRSYTNTVNEGRFEILYRKMFNVAGNDTTAGQQAGTSMFNVDDYIKLRGRKCVFKAAATGQIGDIEQGALYAITVGNQAAGNTAVDANIGYRVRFWDIMG